MRNSWLPCTSSSAARQADLPAPSGSGTSSGRCTRLSSDSPSVSASALSLCDAASLACNCFSTFLRSRVTRYEPSFPIIGAEVGLLLSLHNQPERALSYIAKR